MNLPSLIPWVLAGGLAASIAWNITLQRQLDRIEARVRPTAAAPANGPGAGLPEPLVRSLGLSLEQCASIEGCSLH